MTAVVAALLAVAVLAWPSSRGRLPRPLEGGAGRRRDPLPRDPLRRGAAEGHRGSRSAAAWLVAVVARRRSPAVREAAEEVVLQLVAVMVPTLRAGLPPSRAVQLAREVLGSAGPLASGALPEVAAEASRCAASRWDPRGWAGRSATADACRRLDHMAHAAAAGEPLGPLWHEWARTSGAPALTVLSRAWGLSERTGAPLADGVATAGTAVRTARDTRRAVAAATAGARATMNLLTALPFGGVALAAAVGVEPARLYGSVPTQGSLLLGVGLLLVGRCWVARLTRSATRPERAT